MRKSLVSLVLFGLVAATVGCAAAPKGEPAAPAPPARSERQPPAPPSFNDALRALAKHDAARDWSNTICIDMARLFLEAGASRPALARYNAGIAHQRCGMRAEARAMFEAAVNADPGFSEARVALALAEAADALDKHDFAAAKRRLGDALLTDDTSVPILNQLALTHLAAAASGEGSADVAVLELARSVCDRALALDPKSALVHNTLGLIEARLRRFGPAVLAFDRARGLDPSFFEAHMNAGALHARMGVFGAAEGAYREALRVRAGDYDARLGLSLALRAQTDGEDSTLEARFDEANRELEAAIASAPQRPEAYLNQAFLLLAFMRMDGRLSSERAILKAEALLKAIMAMEGQTRELVRAKSVATMALEDIQETFYCSFKETERDRKEREQRYRIRVAKDYLNADLGLFP